MDKIKNGIIVGILWLVMLVLVCVRFVFPTAFNSFALVPRTFRGLSGIIGMHFLHGGVWHFISNSFVFLPMAFLIYTMYGKAGKIAFWLIPVLSGIGVWLIGRNAMHIGASAWVYGILSFIISSGFYSKSKRNLIIGICVLIAYSGLIWGLLPINPYISWEGHAIGLISGWFLAKDFFQIRKQ